MAFYQSYTTAASGNMAVQFLTDLSAFALSNGWTIDYDGIYTSNRRLHIHKGSAHFDLYETGDLNMNFYGCTGFNGGVASSAQPGVMPSSAYLTLVHNGGYNFISTAGAIYFFLVAVAGNRGWGALVHSVPNKIGAWTFGVMAIGANTSRPNFDYSLYAIPSYGRVHYNGGWSTGVAAGGLTGIYTTSQLMANSHQWYNAGILPFPIWFGIFDLTDSTKVRPMGFFPELYASNGRDVYEVGQSITIGADTFVIMPTYLSEIGHVSYGDFLFKVGA